MSDSWNNPLPNYTLIAENKKPETRIEIEKVPEVKEIVYAILKEDREYWLNEGVLKQPGVEKYNLLTKVSNKLPINSNVFEIALNELEMEQKVIAFQDNNFIRYIIFELKNE